VAVICGASLAVLAAGCGSGSANSGGSGGSGGSSGSGDSGGSTKSETPQQAITDAARASSKLNSAHATVTIATGSETLTERLQLQLHPQLKLRAALNGVSGAGNIQEVIIGDTIYIKLSSLAAQLGGKPWIKLSAKSGGKAGALIHSLLQEASSGNLSSQAQLAKLVTGLHEAGHETVGGVATTRYDGSIKPSAALPHLPASLRSSFAPLLRQIQGNLQVSYWIDGQHLIRKVTEAETVQGQQVHTTILYTDINQPVQINPPPPRQVRDSSTVPGLGG
jgi:hypothetical protein